MSSTTATSRFSTLLQDLLEGAQQRPDDIALVESGRGNLTYGDLVQQVERVSTRLQQHGLQAGDRVLFSVRPSIAAIVLILATARAGGVIVAADPGMGPELFRTRMDLAGVSWGMAETILFVASTSPLRLLAGARGLKLPNLGVLHLRYVRVGPPFPWIPNAIPYSQLLRPLSGPPAPPAVRGSDDPLFIVFTSGTTSDPRAVVHTDATLGATLDAMSQSFSPERGDILYTDQLHSIVPALLAGATAVIPPRRSSPARTRQDLERYRVTHAFTVPFDLQQVVDYCRTNSTTLPSTLRSIVVGAAPAYTGFLDRLAPIISPGTEMWSVYAMTEMLPVCLVRREEKLRYTGSGDLVGRPVAGASLRVTEDGELLVAGPTLCRSYLGSAPLLEHATGDLARIDPDGRVVLLGRKKDMIIRGHHNIYPALYEQAVLGIEGVRWCALIGVYDDAAADESLVLVVEPSTGTDHPRLLRTIRRELHHGRHRIDASAQPDHILFMEVGASGRSHKVDRADLRRRVLEVLPST